MDKIIDALHDLITLAFIVLAMVLMFAYSDYLVGRLANQEYQHLVAQDMATPDVRGVRQMPLSIIKEIE